MIVCYAQGGGLGHLTRIRAYLHTCHGDEPATILSTSPFTADPRVLGPHRLLPTSALPRLRPSLLVVDAFPAGIDGSLSAASVPPGTETVHLARLLRWDVYRPLMPPDPIRYDRIWAVEDLGDSPLSVTGPLSLADPPASGDPDPSGVADGAWLIVHSGPPAEIQELIGYARDCADLEGARPRFVLVAPHRPAGLPSGVGHLDPYPAWPLFARAERVVTAAGFNAVRQMRPWRDRHLMLPFPRRFDDQFTRAARARPAARAASPRLRQR
ncbi:hypothetical protein FHR83_003741 [Actinoplanes campanulatus]|uniref:UDP-N-acetylglucosamine:LPS N-acetylglucosamine transferase n=1 Tax=Actinoplanes campanulatus TaxID=113559 RepID=A0A7W5FF35_9ACTN|nr:hypothetical protein [Actinoplanes campanulatus]MBB3096071.1 hypothetical protein [Actinoplanes campanulatus]GGN13495.1 hypothetical protein GCM10010109_24550 [Actinoplanes campanulatus]GID36835.1 hypothetical protein Aca09nite_33410 [Actinoplanes campanulatus]